MYLEIGTHVEVNYADVETAIDLFAKLGHPVWQGKAAGLEWAESYHQLLPDDILTVGVDADGDLVVAGSAAFYDYDAATMEELSEWVKQAEAPGVTSNV